MATEYLKVMQDSLNKKEQLLKGILELSKEQRDIAEQDTMDWEAFDNNGERKGELIEALLKLDEGFEHIYERVREELTQNTSKYATQISAMKDSIRRVSELGAQIESLEQRNKVLIEKHFSETKKEIKQSKVGMKAAMQYYQGMNKINTVDPQLMDKKS